MVWFLNISDFTTDDSNKPLVSRVLLWGAHLWDSFSKACWYYHACQGPLALKGENEKMREENGKGWPTPGSVTQWESPRVASVVLCGCNKRQKVSTKLSQRQLSFCPHLGLAESQQVTDYLPVSESLVVLCAGFGSGRFMLFVWCVIRCKWRELLVTLINSRADHQHTQPLFPTELFTDGLCLAGFGKDKCHYRRPNNFIWVDIR